MDIQLRAFWRSMQYHAERWNNCRVLITGTTGFLGSFLLRDLLLHTKVRVLSRQHAIRACLCPTNRITSQVLTLSNFFILLKVSFAVMPAYAASLQLFFVVCSTGFCFWRSDAAAPGQPLVSNSITTIDHAFPTHSLIAKQKMSYFGSRPPIHLWTLAVLL